MAKGKQRVPLGGDGAALRQPLGGLAGLGALRDRLPPGPASASADGPLPDPPGAGAPAPHTDAPAPRPESNVYTRAARVVVRRERKGHGGKTMTRLEGLSGGARELDAALRDVKRALGCGATLEGSDVLVQGDQCERLRAFLEARGVRRIVVGN